jgi:peptidoglycan/xylan/chitin deacetylase (PgdA/CDA1 family)
MPRTVLTPPAGGSPTPDIPNWAWHEYGNRVGFWRILKVFDEFKIPGVLAINGSALAAYPPIVEAAMARNWEFMGHGFTQRNMQKVENEREDIRKTADVIAKATGKRPRGWLGPGLTETWKTLDLLQRAGVEYVCDWVNDDLPYRMKNGIYSIPYSIELNDMPLFTNPSISIDDFEKRIRDTFDVLYAEGDKGGRVMGIALHPFLTGVPHRIRYLDRALSYIAAHDKVWLATGSEIIDAFRAQAKA